MDLFRKYFGRKLAKALAEKGLNQTNFADKVGVKAATISRWINGHDFPDDNRLQDIYRVLGVGEAYFDPQEQKPTPTVEKLLAALTELEKENRELRGQLEKPTVETLPKELIELWFKTPAVKREFVLNILRGHAPTASASRKKA